MTNWLDQHFSIQLEIIQALREDKPIVALESTVITHGLPHPQNLNLAYDMESEIRNLGCAPATIAVLDGKVCVGLDDGQLERLAMGENMLKISGRDFAHAIAMGKSGGTTVAGTLLAAHAAGIRVFATGGIGGVHRQAPFDVSADLMQLAQTSMIVVCAGAKAILDLPATLEVLETNGVPVIGYQTDEFPAFYSLSSGLPVSARADTPEEVMAIASAHWGMGMASSVLVAVPPPKETAIKPEMIENVIQTALNEAQEKHIHGQEVTPYLLSRVSELTGGLSLKANLALLLNNARVAAQIAYSFYK
jgi:pseudouridine-5'-phosphate glycosidase